MQANEFKANSLVDKSLAIAEDACVAGKKKPPKRAQASLALRPDDSRIIEAGMKKHGVDKAQIIRMALRRFAEAEGLQVG